MNLRYTRQARADLRNPMRLNPKIVKLCAVLKTHPEWWSACPKKYFQFRV